MKTFILTLLRKYYALCSALFPTWAGASAFRLFQKTRKLPFKKSERQFYNRARKFEVVHPHENIHGYELGNPHGKLVLLVHGWESNAGSMGGIALALAEEGYRVVALDLPAHGYSRLTHTNLRDCREALRALIFQLRPTEPFSIVSHSFGSAVATYALSGSRYAVDDFIMLTSPNRLIDIFDAFRNQISLGNEAYEEMLDRAALLLNEPVPTLSVEDKALQVQYNQLTIIHDVNDKVLPYAISFRLANRLPRTNLIPLKNTGHYRMLWNTEVVSTILEQLTATPEELSKFIPERMSA